MPLAYKPHVLGVYSASEIEASGNVLGTERIASTSVTGQLTPMSARQLTESWGIEIERPHLFLCDLADRGLVNEGDWLTHGDRKFFVRTKQIWDAEPSTACCAFALEEMD